MSRLSVGESSGLGAAIVFGLIFIARVVIRHSGPDGSELVKVMEEMNARQRSIAEVNQATIQQLAKITDAESAMSVDLTLLFTQQQDKLDEINSEGSDLEVLGLLSTKVSAANAKKLEELGEESAALDTKYAATIRSIVSEIERIRRLQGLPVEFWSEARFELAFQLAAAYEELWAYEDEDNFYETDPAAIDSLVSLLEQHGSERVVTVSLSNISGNDFSRVYKDLREVEDGDTRVEKWYDTKFERGFIILAPTTEYQTYLEKLPVGDFTINEEVRRTVAMDVVKMREEEPKVVEAIVKEEPKVEIPKPPEEEQQPDESLNEYYIRLANLLLDNQSSRMSGKALDKLLALDPTSIPDKKTIGIIARNFRQLALQEDSRGQQGQAIDGLVLYGRKYCVPILLEMYESEKITALQECYSAFAEYPNEKVANAMVDRLSESRRDDQLVDCLRQMGEVTELPLIRAARTDDKNVLTTIVELLGEVGTEKSYALIRKSTKSKDEKMSELAKASLLKIRQRIKAQKEVSKSS